MRPLQDTEIRGSFVRALFCSSIVVSLLLSWGLLYSRERGIAVLEAVFAGIFCVSWVAIPYLERRRLPVRWFLSIGILNILLVAPELILRIVNFKYRMGIQFGFPKPTEFRFFKADSNLFWTHDPAMPEVNSWGFREREILPNDKPADTTRILFLGDSCTEQGYPESVEPILNADRTGRSFECISLSMAGYTTFQGRRVAESYGGIVNPDIVVVYYGWNDHWLAYGSTDSQKKDGTQTGGAADLRDTLYRSRLLQFIEYVFFHGRQDSPKSEPRVSLEEYRANLAAIYRLFEATGAYVVFVTAPTSHYSLGIPDALVKRGLLTDKDSAIAMHKKYNEAVRSLQKECALSAICDLEANYAQMTPSELRTVFLGDGIHFSDYGLVRLAYDISKVIRQLDNQRAPTSTSSPSLKESAGATDTLDK